MVTIYCNSCNNLLNNCGHSFVNNQSIGYIHCSNCQTTGRYRDKMRMQYKFVDQDVFNAKVMEFQDYKKKNFIDHNLVLRTLINYSTYEFTKKFDNFKRNFEKEDAKFAKKVEETTSKMLKTTEQFIKKEIIKETKNLSRLLEEQGSDVQKMKMKVKDKRQDLRAELMSTSIYQVPEINEIIALFDKKINRYNNRMQVYDKLNQQSSHITCQQVGSGNQQSSSVSCAGSSAIEGEDEIDQ